MKSRILLCLTAIALFVPLAIPVRVAAHSRIVTFDPLGAGTGPYQGTYVSGIVESGRIAGFYIDAGNVSHGFLRSRDGAITTFDAPEAGTGAGQGTTVIGLNQEGAIVGYYTDTNNAIHGFLRTPDHNSPHSTHRARVLPASTLAATAQGSGTSIFLG